MALQFQQACEHGCCRVISISTITSTSDLQPSTVISNSHLDSQFCTNLSHTCLHN